MAASTSAPPFECFLLVAFGASAAWWWLSKAAPESIGEKLKVFFPHMNPAGLALCELIAFVLTVSVVAYFAAAPKEYQQALFAGLGGQGLVAAQILKSGRTKRRQKSRSYRTRYPPMPRLRSRVDDKRSAARLAMDIRILGALLAATLVAVFFQSYKRNKESSASVELTEPVSAGRAMVSTVGFLILVGLAIFYTRHLDGQNIAANAAKETEKEAILAGQRAQQVASIETLKKSLGEKELVLAGVNSKVSSLEASVARLAPAERTAAEANGRAAMLQGHVDSLTAELKARTDEVALLRAKTEDAAAEAGRLAAMNASLKSALDASKVEVVGDGLKFENAVLFAPYESTISNDNKDLMAKMVAFVEYKLATSKGSFTIIGHTDITWNNATFEVAKAKNLDLSIKRANSVKKYLADAGVPANRLTAVGRGLTHPGNLHGTSAGPHRER